MQRRDGGRSEVKIKMACNHNGSLKLPQRYMEEIDWDNGDNYLILGDSLDVMQSIPDSVVDLIYNDPPFNTGKTFKNNKAFVDSIKNWRAKRAWPELGQSNYSLPQ